MSNISRNVIEPSTRNLYEHNNLKHRIVDVQKLTVEINMSSNRKSITIDVPVDIDTINIKLNRDNHRARLPAQTHCCKTNVKKLRYCKQTSLYRRRRIRDPYSVWNAYCRTQINKTREVKRAMLIDHYNECPPKSKYETNRWAALSKKQKELELDEQLTRYFKN